MKLKLQFSKLSLCLAFCLTGGELSAEPATLSDSDRRELQDQLDEVLNVAKSTSEKRFVRAMSAFRSAIDSDSAAYELYLECYERVNFIDKQKSGQDFREWKRKHNDREDLTEFKRVLRHQLNWLLLSIEASAKPEDIYQFSDKAVKKIDTIMSELEQLKSQQKILSRSVLSSVYAKAFDINGLEADGWPLSPTDITNVYENLVMPPIRDEGNATRLRAAWIKRIKQVGQMKLEWSNTPESNKVGIKKETEAPDYVKWLDDGYLKLLWSMEKDCYAVGDEVTASRNMLTHVKKHIKHKLSLEWVKELEGIINSGGEAEVIEPSTSSE